MEQLHLQLKQQPGERGHLYWGLRFSPPGSLAAHPGLRNKPSDMLAPSLAAPWQGWLPHHAGEQCEHQHAGAGWLPVSRHSGCQEGPLLAGNVSLAHRRQLTALCRCRPGAPAVLISIIQAPCVSHSPAPLGFLLPVNKHVSLCFLHGGLCREQFWPQTDHHRGLIFLSACFYLQHDERFFLPFIHLFLSNYIYCMGTCTFSFVLGEPLTLAHMAYSLQPNFPGFDKTPGNYVSITSTVRDYAPA